MRDDNPVVEVTQPEQQERNIQNLDEVIQAALRINKAVVNPEFCALVFRGWIAARFGTAIR